MNSIILNVAIVYGTAYMTKEVISYSMYYTAYYSALYIKNRVIEQIYSYIKKDPPSQNVELTVIT